MTRKRNHRMHRAAPAATASFAVLANSQTIPEDKATALMVPTSLALVRMLDGTAEEEHFHRLGTDINVAHVRLEDLDIKGDRAATFHTLQLAGEALAFAARIHEQHGRYGLTGPGRQHLQDGVDAYEAILRASTPRQMDHAQHELLRRYRAMQAGKAQIVEA